MIILKIFIVVALIALVVYIGLLIQQERFCSRFLALCTSDPVQSFSHKQIEKLSYHNLEKYRFTFAVYIQKMVEREDFWELWRFVQEKDLLLGKKKDLCDNIYMHVLSETSAYSLAQIYSQGIELYLNDGSHDILDSVVETLSKRGEDKKSLFRSYVFKNVNNMIMRRIDTSDPLRQLCKEMSRKLAM